MGCRHKWEENWKGDFYCEVCGILKKEIKRYRKEVSRPESRAATSQDELIRQIERHPTYGYVKKLTETIAADYGVKIRVSFRNMMRADHRKKDDGSSVIRYGYQMLDYDARNGYQDLKSLHWSIWGEAPSKMVGKKAAWALVLHETAHLGVRDQRVRGEMHGPAWAAEVRNLQELYPFEG